MRVLLDTHALLWWLAEDPKLAPDVCALIGRVDSEVHVSLASCWELAIKVATGKLRFPLDMLEGQLLLNRFQLLPITIAHITAGATLPFHHRDPFDRMLIAQAQAEGLTIITRDARIDEYDVRCMKT
ncbi:MAG: type II toxin-antitoxin system VapC family toxin [Gammaproteobacteria bacterium]